MSDQLHDTNRKDHLNGLKVMVARYNHIKDASEQRLWRAVIDTRIKHMIADGVKPAAIAAIVPWYANIPEAE